MGIVRPAGEQGTHYLLQGLFPGGFPLPDLFRRLHETVSVRADGFYCSVRRFFILLRCALFFLFCQGVFPLAPLYTEQSNGVAGRKSPRVSDLLPAVFRTEGPIIE